MRDVREPPASRRGMAHSIVVFAAEGKYETGAGQGNRKVLWREGKGRGPVGADPRVCPLLLRAGPRARPIRPERPQGDRPYL